MAIREPMLTDEKWERIRFFIPVVPKSPKGGAPRCDDRRVLEGLLWILRTGARWIDLPEEFPSPSTCWRRLNEWEEKGVWLAIWRRFVTL